MWSVETKNLSNCICFNDHFSFQTKKKALQRDCLFSKNYLPVTVIQESLRIGTDELD